MANKHQPWDLAQMQSLPLEAKIRMTKERIRQWYEHWNGMVYVSFSGGKDSTVLKHIVDSMYDDVPSLFINTGLEYPEIQKFAMSQKNVVTVRPEMRFDEVLKKYGYPVVTKRIAETIYYAKKNISEGKNTLRVRLINGVEVSKEGFKSKFNAKKWKFLIEAPFDVSKNCCKCMKIKPASTYKKQTGRVPFLATMTGESLQRYSAWLVNGCNAYNTKDPVSAPMAFWTEQDILHYIKKYNVPYCSVYGDIVVDEKPDGDEILNGQINMIDYLGCHDEKTKLRTTGCDRTGCIFCGFGCHLEKSPNRFQRLKETHPRQYEYCIGGGEYNEEGKWVPSKEGLGLGKVLDYIGVKYE